MPSFEYHIEIKNRRNAVLNIGGNRNKLKNMKKIALPSGETVPALGQGTWNMGDSRATRAEEIASLRLGLDLGLTLIDTAEMYGSGRSEELVAEALAGRRDEAFIVSKVLPSNARSRDVVLACERSLKRLKTDRIDLYLLHWRGDVSFAETLDGFVRLLDAGKIRHYGVSNLDLADMEELWSLPGGPAVTTNQVLYNLARRGIEWDLLPWMRKRHMPVMAYSPIEQARLVRNAKLIEFGKRNGMSAAQAAIAWLLAQQDVMVIPKTGNAGRMRENAVMASRALDAAQLAELDRLFPPPTEAVPLDMI
jgi:diketogulonate reductase-like aldo/keto reductase